MRIAICDDEPLCLAQVTSVAKEYAKEYAEDKVNENSYYSFFKL